MSLKNGYTNSKIECPIYHKNFAKNYLTNHLKVKHSNCYGTDYWFKYSDRYKTLLADNKKSFV